MFTFKEKKYITERKETVSTFQKFVRIKKMNANSI